MESAAKTSVDRGPPPRLRIDPGRAARRAIGLGLGFFVAAAACGVSMPVALLLTAVVLLGVGGERLAVRAEAGRRLEVATSAAQTEGHRDAAAQLMSLELAYERSRSVFEALREGVIVVDEGGEIVVANPAARRAMRWPTQDPVGSPLWEALTPDLANRAREAWLALSDRNDNADELPQIRYSGIRSRDNIYDLTAVEATSARTGQNFGTVFLIVDSTRTHELQRLKDRFLSSVSHELRTPLTNICAYSEILCQMLPGESAEWPEFVRVIHDEGVQLSDLVDALFDYLQLESGEAVFASDALDGASIVGNVVTQLLPKARLRHIDLDFAEVDEPPMLVADRRRLEQVARHLIDNAIKFSPEHGRVSVQVAGRDEGWEMRIEDNGPGVPMHDRQAVFEKFSQLPDLLTEKPSGTGIGLAISRAIVARFGGLIWCEDSAYGGASFVVLLPAVGQPRLATFAAGTGAGGGF